MIIVTLLAASVYFRLAQKQNFTRAKHSQGNYGDELSLYNTQYWLSSGCPTAWPGPRSLELSHSYLVPIMPMNELM